MEPQISTDQQIMQWLGIDAEQLSVFKQAAPVIIQAAQNFNLEDFEELIASDFNVNYPITDTRMNVLMYICSFNGCLVDENRANYIKML